MRLWSLHPKYLDTKGLIALWRESLLAKKVLEGKTIRYTQHPQLIRFKNSGRPIQFLLNYLYYIWLEADRRNYNFNYSKINGKRTNNKLIVTIGQIKFEKDHLLKKLIARDLKKCQLLKNINKPLPHPLFSISDGEKEDWEKTITNYVV